jgi:hypothetical protein
MTTKSSDGRWLGFLAAVCFVTAVACGGGGSGGGTGLPSGTACVTVNDGAEVCTTSDLRTDRGMSSGEIRMSVYRPLNPDCFSRAADEFTVNLAIPDGLPFPYQATHRRGNAAFGTGACGWLTKEANVVTGTIYQAATNGATNLEGDVTVPYSANPEGSTDNRDYQCGTGCPGTASARFRFNVPL